LILYFKLVISRGKIKNKKCFKVHYHVVVKDKLSWIVFSFFNITFLRGTQKGSHIKWWHVLRIYLNIKKNIIKPKSIRNCATWFSTFCKSHDFFLQRKSDQIFPFHIYFSHLCKISKQREEKTCHDKCIWMFSITLSHFEKITWIFAYGGCHNQFLRKHFHI